MTNRGWMRVADLLRATLERKDPPMSDTTKSTLLRMPEAPAELQPQAGVKGLWRYMGPGLILASASVGSGEIFFSTRGGATFGYVLLWTFVASVILKGVVVYSGARYITLTGESPFARFGQVLPGPKNWFPVLLGIFAVVSFPTWAGGFAKFLGQWSVWTFGFGEDRLWATFWIALVFATLFFAHYDYIEKFQTWVVITMVLFVLIAVMVANPNWLEVLRGLIPSIPGVHEQWVVDKYPEIAAKPMSLEIVAYLGALGGGTYDYIGYIGMYNEKKWGMLGNPDLKGIRERLITLHAGEQIAIDESPEQEATVRSWLKAPAMDAFVSFAAVLLFSAAFMILGNVILGTDGKQLIPNDREIMQHQAAFFEIINPALLYFYKLAVWAAFFGSMQASGTIMYAHTFHECFAPAFKKIREANFFHIRLLVAIIYCFGGLLLVWTDMSFTKLVSFGSIVGGVLSIGLWAFAMLYTDIKFIPKKYQMSTLIKVLLAICGVVMTIMGGVALVQYIQTF